jgi:hypothetical protein
VQPTGRVEFDAVVSKHRALPSSDNDKATLFWAVALPLDRRWAHGAGLGVDAQRVLHSQRLSGQKKLGPKRWKLSGLRVVTKRWGISTSTCVAGTEYPKGIPL